MSDLEKALTVMEENGVLKWENRGWTVRGVRYREDVVDLAAVEVQELILVETGVTVPHRTVVLALKNRGHRHHQKTKDPDQGPQIIVSPQRRGY